MYSNEIFLSNDGETPASIDAVMNNGQQSAGVYNIGGQRLNTPAKGINIINGKKVFIK